MFSMNSLKTLVWRLVTKSRSKLTLLILLILCCIGVTCYSHFILHSGIIFSHFYYLPIVLAAFWWGRRAIWVALFLGAWLVTSNVVAGLGTPVPDLLRVGMFIAVGLVVGILREQILNTEQRLRETGDYLSSLIQHSNTPIVVWDKEAKITLFNPAFERLTGYRADEILGQSVEVLFPQERREQIFQKINKILEGQSWETVEIPVRCENGQIATCLWNSANIHAPDGKSLIATIAHGQDITDRKQAEEIIEKAHFELDQILETAADGIRIIDKNFNVVRVNTTLAKMAGLNKEDMLGKKCYEAFKGELCHTENCLLKRIFSGENYIECEVEKERLDGSRIPCLVVSRPYRSPDGELIGIIDYLRDISELKRLNGELEAAKTYAENIIANFLDTLIVTNPDGTIRTINQATLDLLEYKEEELIGKPVGMIFAEEEEEEEVKPFFTGTLEELAKRGVLRNYELTYKTKSGRRIPMSFNASVMRDEKGEVMGLVAGAKDISKLKEEINERKRAEKALRESQRFFSSTLNNLLTFIGVLEPNGKVIFVNNTALDTAGIKLEDVMGKMFYDTYWWAYSHEAQQMIRDYTERCASGETFSGEIQIQVAGGSLRWIEFSMHPIYDEKGKVRYLVPEGRDITERKRAEESLRKSEAQLRQAQKMEAVGQLAGGVAHDFNNILQAIQGYTEIALMTVKEDNPLYSNLTEIRKAAVRAANLTRQLLLFSRRQPMERTPLDLNGVIHDLGKMLNRLIGEDISLNTDLSPELWTVKGDAGSMEQLIMNLVVNARDAMPDGGNIWIRTENVFVDEDYCNTHKYACPGRFIRLSVQDTGVGMDKVIIDRIFEPFFTTKGSGRGTGMGLSVVYGIVKQHEGWIDVESSPGKGAIFRIYLPAVSMKPKDEQEMPVSLEELRGRGERILLVEDDESVRELSEEMLSENGYRVYAAANAREALDIFEKEGGNFDLVFCDVILPDDRGPRLANQLLKIRPGITILFASGYNDEKSDLRIIRDGGHLLLQKPYSLADLLKGVRESLKKK